LALLAYLNANSGFRDNSLFSRSIFAASLALPAILPARCTTRQAVSAPGMMLGNWGFINGQYMGPDAEPQQWIRLV
jgi:hypothetical protein